MAVTQNSGLIRFSNVSGAQTFHMPGGNFVAGRCGVLCVALYNNATNVDITSVTIGGTAATRRALATADASNGFEIWVAENMAGGTDAVVITGGTGYYYSGGCIEIDNVVASGFDQANTSSLTSSTAPSVATSTLAQADSIVIAGFVQCDGATPTINNPPTGYTAIFEEEDGANQEPGAASYKIVSATTAVTTTWAMGSAANWQAGVIVLKVSAAGGGAVVAPEPQPPAPRRTIAHRVDAWAPLAAIAAGVATAKWGFTDPPAPRRPQSPRVEQGAPLPSVAIPTVNGWGFSGGEQVVSSPPRVQEWNVVAALPAAASAKGVDCQAPLVRKVARAVPDGWEPLAPLPGALLELQPVTPSRVKRAVVGDWEPIPLLGPALPTLVEPQPAVGSRLPRAAVADWEPLAPIGDPAVDCQAPDPRRLTRALPDGWEPLGQLPVATAAALVESQTPANRPIPRANVGDWDPLPQIASLAGVPATGFDVGYPTAPARGRAPVDNWEPLPGVLAATPSAFGYECASPINPRAKTRQPDAWQPLAAVTLAPTVPSGFECSTFLPRKVRAPVVDAWQPLGAVVVAAPNVPGVGSQAPEPRRNRPAVAEQWAPLAGLGSPSVDFTSPLPTTRRAVLSESWEPIASLPGLVTVECQPARVRSARPPVVDGWLPLPGLPVALLAVAFSGEAQRPNIGIARVGDWEPLPALIPPPPVLPWVDFVSPITKFTVSRVAESDGGSSSGWIGGVVVSTLFVPAARPGRIIAGGYNPRRRTV